MNRYIKMIITTFGFVIVMMGVMMNDFVIANNNGKMPVIDFNGKSNNHLTLYQNATNETKYLFLCDNQNYGGFSLGDSIMYIGAIVLFIGIITKENNQ